MSVCRDCADAADARVAPISAYHSPGAYIEAVAGHDRCAARNWDREPGQLPGCTCQHVVGAQTKESATP